MDHIDDKRKAILDTTLDLVAKHGFHGTAMAKIAKQAHVSAGIIYHYFDGKDDLLHALYRDIKAQLGRALMAGDPYTLTAPHNLKRLWLNAYDFCVQHPREIFYLEQYENSPYSATIDASHMQDDPHYARLLQMMADEFERGTIEALPLMVIYEMTIGVAIGLAKRQIAGAVQLDDALLDQIAMSCYEAVRKR
jgi:AcrR family transcriptional regulator